MITVENIQKAVSRHYGLNMADMKSTDRSHLIARPRQVAMALSREMTFLSLPKIGRLFGHRDHTTVLHAIRCVEARQAGDETLVDDLKIIKTKLARLDRIKQHLGRGQLTNEQYAKVMAARGARAKVIALRLNLKRLERQRIQKFNQERRKADAAPKATINGKTYILVPYVGADRPARMAGGG